MRRRSRQCVFLLLAAELAVLSASTLAQKAGQNLTDDQIRQLLVQASIAAYAGNCPCPENRNSASRRCGGNSAYSRPGGSHPLCYPSDVSDVMVKRYRDGLAAK